MKRLLFLILALQLTIQVAHCAPAAILTRVTGKVTVVRGGKSLPGKNGLALQNGDKVVATQGAATIFALGAPPRTVKNGVAVVASGAGNNGTSPGLLSTVYAGLSHGLGNNTRTVAAAMRRKQVFSALAISPCQTKLDTNLPHFAGQFEGIPGAERVEITIKDAAKKTIWQTQTAEKNFSLDYPADAPPLSGPLTWEIELQTQTNGVWGRLPDSVSDEVPFEVASPAQLKGILDNLKSLEPQIAAFNPTERALLRASLWSQAGFKEKALQELDNAGEGDDVYAFRRNLWLDMGQQWRADQADEARKVKIGGADRTILALKPDAPLVITQLKTFVEPQGAFSLQIPARFSSSALTLVKNVQYTQIGTASDDGARLTFLRAPSRDFAGPDDLLHYLSGLIDQTNALETNKGNSAVFSTPHDATFRGQAAHTTQWIVVNKGVTSVGETLEWHEGDTDTLIAWGGQNGDAAAIRPLLDTLQIGKEVQPSKPAAELLALQKLSLNDLYHRINDLEDSSLVDMKEYNKRGGQPSYDASQLDSKSLVSTFNALDAERQKASKNSFQRATSASAASQVASRIAWDASSRGDSATAARYFGRRSSLDTESYQAEDMALQAEADANEMRIALWTSFTPPLPVAVSYQVMLNGLFLLRSMYQDRRYSLAIGESDVKAMKSLSLDALNWARVETETKRLEAASASEVEDNQQYVADALDRLAYAQQEEADLDGARAYYQRAIQWRRVLPDSSRSRTVASSLSDLAALEHSLGDNRLARDYYEQALVELDRLAPLRQKSIDTETDADLRQLKRANDGQTHAIILNHLGLIYETLGDFTQAETSYKKALESVDTIPEASREMRTLQRADTLASLAVLHADSGDLKTAGDLLGQAVELNRSVGNISGLALALLNSAGIDAQGGNPTKALAKIAIARPIFVQLQESSFLVAADVFSAKLARQRGDYKLATAKASSALVLARSLRNWDWVASAARSLANIRMDGVKTTLSPLDKAQVLAYIVEAEHADGLSASAQSQIYTLGAHARWQEKSGDLSGAVDTLKSAVTRLERIRATAASSQQFSDIESNLELYNEAVHLLLQLKRPDEAFDMMSRARSQKLRENLKLSARQSANPALQKLLDRAAALDEKLAKTRAQLASENALPAPQRDTNKISNLNDLISSTQAEFFEVSKQIKDRNPRFDKSLSLSPTELKKAQRAIPEGTLLLQYAALDDGLYIFAVTRDSLKIYAPKVSKTQLQSAVHSYRDAIDADLTLVGNGKAPSSIDDPKSLLRIASESLSKWLLAPVQDEIDASRVVAVIPSGELFYLPFHALGETDKNGKWRFLIEEKPVAYLAAGDVLSVATARDDSEGGRGLLALGDPTGADLPAAKLEVESIARLFPESRALTGADAEKSVLLLPASRNKRILHLAAHGILNSARPDQSFIQLSPSKTDDGKLSVGEIYGLDLSRVDLVTLSACQTALGEGEPDGSEISSLAQSFSSAGTPSVIASLWNVEDQSTSHLMESFYGAMADGKPKGIALQNAQVTLLRDPKTRHPLFWAPFELLGDWR